MSFVDRLEISFFIWLILVLASGCFALWFYAFRQSMSPDNKRTAWRAFCVLCALVVLFPFGAMWVMHIPSQKEQKFYDSLRIGEMWNNSRAADGTTQYGKYTILYFWGYGPGPYEGEVPQAVSSLEELPRTYDAIELMLDSDGRIVAKTHCEETDHVQTIKGDFQGACLRELDDSLFQIE